MRLTRGVGDATQTEDGHVTDWYMLTLVGEDRAGIVAAVTQALYERAVNLGETAMMRLGGNFAVMMMVSGASSAEAVEAAVRPTAERLGLRIHVDAIAGGLHRHVVPNVRVRVSGADRAGIVAQVTGALAEHGFNILELASDVAGTERQPVYIMHIEGYSDAPLEQLQSAVAPLAGEGVDVQVAAVDTLYG
jgi:glycine cleavage system transcriptional repressor